MSSLVEPCLKADEPATTAPEPAAKPKAVPPEIIWRATSPRESIDDAILALKQANVFQQAGRLVEIVRDATPNERGAVPDSNPRAAELSPGRLSEIIADKTRVIRLRRVEPKGADAQAEKAEAKIERERIPVPKALAQGVIDRGQWHHVRPLVGLADYPVLRPDGTILCSRGYDGQTGYYVLRPLALDVPEHPTVDDARAALEVLYELVADFAFATPAHRSAWVAGLLTILARPAIDGPVPMLVAEAPERGSGKTLLADLYGALTTGRPLSRTASPMGQGAEDEWRKKLLAIARSGSPVELFDNVVSELRAAALDAALTGGVVKDRILGQSADIAVPFRTFMIATVNNTTVSPDLVRRVIVVRIAPECERPAERTAFKFPGDLLLRHARDNRARYTSAAFTILRAFDQAGVTPTMRGMGSFDAWSRRIRAPLVWLGAPDPAETQDGLRQTGDAESGAVTEFMIAWHDAFKDKPRSVAQVTQALVSDYRGDSDLAAAVSELLGTVPGKTPSAKALGKRLSALRDKRAGGFVFRYAGEDAHAKVKLWRVEPAISRPEAA